MRQELSERHRLRRAFWTRLLDHVKATNTRLHANISPSRESWIGTGAGRSGVGYNYGIVRHATRVELYIGGPDPKENQRIFDALHAQRESIEKVFGEPLDWQALEGRKACRISKTLELGGWSDEDRWETVIPATVDAMSRLHRALKGPLRQV